MNTTVNEKIKLLKKESGLTTRELAEKSSVPIGTLNKILCGQTKSIKSETLASIASALGKNASDLLADRGNSFTVKKVIKNHGYLRVAAVTPNVVLGNEKESVSGVLKAIEELNNEGVSLIVFPELSVTGYTLSDLFYQDTILKNAEKSLLEIVDFTKNYETLIFLGCPLLNCGKIYNTAVAVFKGEILGVVPKSFIPNYNEFYERRVFSPAPEEDSEISIGGKSYPFGKKLIFKDIDFPGFSVAAEICEDLWTANSPSVMHSLNGANIVVNLSASNEIVGKAEYRRNLISMQSAKCVCGYVYSDAGNYESTTDLVFSAHNIIAENGKILTESEPFGKGVAISDIDLSFIEYEKRKVLNYVEKPCGYLEIFFKCGRFSDGGLKKYEKTPFVPFDKKELSSRINTILEIQSRALARRISHVKAKSVVIGVSGGLDSTLALLASCRAMDLLNRGRKDVLAITMPCFGTSKRTKRNSVLLAKALGATLREIDITGTVLSHFKDIGQSVDDKDVTYENAQARERTQVIMDIANKTGGIVVGTGDLSELALGWATYNGDHMSMYGVNSSIPKTLVKHIVNYVADTSEPELRSVLKDILATPVSPELIPAKEGEEISQKTEDIVGPYVLHDFFLYHFVRNGFAPSKIYEIAKRTFKGDYSDDEIFKWLHTFIRRFFAQQFKRSCVPDGVKVGSVSLSPRGDWRMPSDISASLWLTDLENSK